MIRFLGAALLVAGCGGFGLSIAFVHRKEVQMLRNMIDALQEMEWELKYRMPNLAGLCTIAGNTAGGTLKEIFGEMAARLKRKDITDISAALNHLVMQKDLPRSVRKNMKQLGATLGRFDLEGQIQGLEIVRRQCRKDLKKLEDNSTQRLRSYQTLAWCAGAALAILMI